jgi:hypothetical protein
VTASPALAEELRTHVARKIGAIAKPDDIIFAADPPKTRSGKIMRRLLRDIAEGKAQGTHHPGRSQRRPDAQGAIRERRVEARAQEPEARAANFTAVPGVYTSGSARAATRRSFWTLTPDP